MQISDLQVHPSYCKKRMPDSLCHTLQFNFHFDWHLYKGITSSNSSMVEVVNRKTAIHLNITIDNMC